ncbi:MAG TPA: hypothetical protein VEA41_04150 [Salinarimonas sp.]|nr:hypothetical protein [Salinarimonas sp.]
MTPAERKLLHEAWQALEEGRADRQQGARIIRHLASLTNYYGTTYIGEWMKQTGRVEGFELSCVEHQARRWVFASILPFLSCHPDGRAYPADEDPAAG